MANDALVWGVEQMPRIMSHIRNEASIEKYGRFQSGEWSQQMYKSESVTSYAKTIVNRLSRPLTFFTARAFRPGVYPGDVISVSANGAAEEYVAKQVSIGFITRKQPFFDISLGIHPEDPWKSYDVVPFITKPLEALTSGTFFGIPYDISSSDQPYMPVIETWDRSPGTVLTQQRFGVYRIEYIEEYHWEPGLDFQTQAHSGFMMSTCDDGPIGGSLNTGGQPSANICGCAGFMGPDNGWFGNDCCNPGTNVHYNAPYSRIPREYPENRVMGSTGICGWTLGCYYYDYSRTCFCYGYCHVYSAWHDNRQVAWYSPLASGLGGPSSLPEGTPGSARIKFVYSALAPSSAFSGFTWGSNPSWYSTEKVSSMQFEVRHIEAPAGALDLPGHRTTSVAYPGYLHWVWNYPSHVVAEFEVIVPETGSDYVTAEIPYPDHTKDHAWILICKTPRKHNYGGQYGPCSWGYYRKTNGATDSGWPPMDPFPPMIGGQPAEGIIHDHNLYHRAYEIAIATCMEAGTMDLNFPPVVGVNASLLIETNAHGNLFDDDYPTVRTWDPVHQEYYDKPNPLWDEIVDKGWGTEDVLVERDSQYGTTGWFYTTWPFQTDSLEIYESGLLIDKTHYIIGEVPEDSPSPWPTRYRVDYSIVVENSWVRYNSRPLQLNTHQTGDGRYQG